MFICSLAVFNYRQIFWFWFLSLIIKIIRAYKNLSHKNWMGSWKVSIISHFRGEDLSIALFKVWVWSWFCLFHKMSCSYWPPAFLPSLFWQFLISSLRTNFVLNIFITVVLEEFRICHPLGQTEGSQGAANVRRSFLWPLPICLKIDPSGGTRLSLVWSLGISWTRWHLLGSEEGEWKATPHPDRLYHCLASTNSLGLFISPQNHFLFPLLYEERI
jgi:hypothetical protein